MLDAFSLQVSAASAGRAADRLGRTPRWHFQLAMSTTGSTRANDDEAATVWLYKLFTVSHVIYRPSRPDSADILWRWM